MNPLLRPMLLAATLAAGLVPSLTTAPRAAAAVSLTPGARDVIVHLFRWPRASVAQLRSRR